VKRKNEILTVEDEFPALIGYSKECIDPDNELTDSQLNEVCRKFNEADWSHVAEILEDIKEEVMKNA